MLPFSRVSDYSILIIVFCPDTALTNSKDDDPVGGQGGY